MKVTFTRTAERRYRVSVEGSGVVSSAMEPAAGYDDRLPHDMAHFVVENTLGIAGGVFGQLAQGGHAHTFHPTGEQASGKIVRRGNRVAAANRKDAMLSEKVVHLACSIWNNLFSELPKLEGVTIEDFKRVCQEFDAVSAVWSKLGIGESMTLVWRGNPNRRRQTRSTDRKSRPLTRKLRLKKKFARQSSVK